MQKKRVMILVLVALLLIAILAFAYVLSQRQNQEELNRQNNSRQENKQAEQQQESDNNQTEEKQKEETPSFKAPKAEDLKSLDGLVKFPGENSLTVEFQYEDTTWQSKVNTTEETFIGQPPKDDNSGPKETTLSQIQSGNKVIISSQENIFNKDTFEAAGVMVVE
ncbi:MAG: hypothetical protein R6V40_01655 [Candidatus Moraniibacteriota bacterium]